MEVVERELKYQLNKKDYKKICMYMDKNGVKCSSIIQINYYIDNDEFILNKSNITARIRKGADGKYKFTLKIPLNNRDYIKHATIKKEVSIELNNITDNDLNENKYLEKKIIDMIGGSIKLPIELAQLKIIGVLTTERSLYSIEDSNDIITIDKSSYLDIEDYEVEWETSKLDKNNKILLKIFDTVGIKYIESDSSKSSRYIDKLRSLQLN